MRSTWGKVMKQLIIPFLHWAKINLLGNLNVLFIGFSFEVLVSFGGHPNGFNKIVVEYMTPHILGCHMFSFENYFVAFLPCFPYDKTKEDLPEPVQNWIFINIFTPLFKGGIDASSVMV